MLSVCVLIRHSVFASNRVPGVSSTEPGVMSMFLKLGNFKTYRIPRIPHLSTLRIPHLSTPKIPKPSTPRIPKPSTPKIPYLSTPRIPNPAKPNKYIIATIMQHMNFVHVKQLLMVLYSNSWARDLQLHRSTHYLQCHGRSWIIYCINQQTKRKNNIFAHCLGGKRIHIQNKL